MLRYLLILAMLPVCACAETDPACAAAGMTEQTCRDPLLGAWTNFRYVMDGKQGPLRSTQAQAIADAIDVIRRIYPCGLSHAPTPNPTWKSLTNLWAWSTSEETVGAQFSGFRPDDPRTCGGNFHQNDGVIIVRRDRKVSCPKDFNWLVRDNDPGLCIRD